MKDWRLKELKDFLEVANSIDSPFKFFQVFESEIKASIWLRTALITWVGERGEDRIKQLKENGFKEVEELETKRIGLEDLL